MRRFLDARALEPDPSGSCVAALDKATEVARGAGLEGMAVDYPLQDWVRTTRGRVQDRVVWKGLEVFIVTDATAANMAASGELVSWAAGLMASKADDVGAKPVVVPGGMVVRKYRSGTADTIHFGAGDGHQIWERDHVTGELLAKTQGGPLLGGSPTIEQFDAIPGEWTLVGTALGAMADDVEPKDGRPCVCLVGNCKRHPERWDGNTPVAPDSYVATLIDIMGMPADTTRVGVLAELEKREAARVKDMDPVVSAPVEPRDEIYRRLRLANDKAEAALDALEATVQLIRMLRGGGDV